MTISKLSIKELKDLKVYFEYQERRCDHKRLEVSFRYKNAIRTIERELKNRKPKYYILKEVA